MRYTTMMIAAAAALAAPALAGAGTKPGDVKAGVDAWSRGDPAAAVAEWEGPAAAGDADAQFNLAQAYKLGKGVPADLKKAEALYRKAADQGHLQAADNYGLLLFQTGRREQALAWLVPSAERGEPRAQYVLGVAHFNGDMVPRDPVRAYALMTRAAAAGLEQARMSLADMDRNLPLAQRQQAAALATELERKAESQRAAQVAAAGLGTERRAIKPPKAPAPPAKPQGPLKPAPVLAGADFANPVVLGSNAARTATIAAPRADPPAKPMPVPAKAAAKPGPAVPPGGDWRVQLGAFAVRSNADGLWARLEDRPALAGRQASFVAAGRLTRLQAGPFASRGEAEAACRRLPSPCVPVRE